MCHEDPDIWDCPMNSDVPTRCTHWLCVGCWARIAGRDQRCPICRDDLSVWLRQHGGAEDREDDSEDEDSEDDNEADLRAGRAVR